MLDVSHFWYGVPSIPAGRARQPSLVAHHRKGRGDLRASDHQRFRALHDHGVGILFIGLAARALQEPDAVSQK